MSQSSDPLPFELRSLEVFLSVCDCGTMSSAARILGLTQSAVSQTIAELEQRVNANLFDRNVRPLGLTVSGVLLRQRASALLADARQIAPLLQGRPPQQAAPDPGGAGRFLFAIARAGSSEPSQPLRRPCVLCLRSDLFARRRPSRPQARYPPGSGRVRGSRRSRELAPARGALCHHSAASRRRRRPRSRSSPSSARKLKFVRYHPRRKIGVSIERHLRRLGVELRRAYEYDTPFAVSATVAKGESWAITTPLCIFESGDLARNFVCLPLPGARVQATAVAHIPRSRACACAA